MSLEPTVVLNKPSSGTPTLIHQQGSFQVATVFSVACCIPGVRVANPSMTEASCQLVADGLTSSDLVGAVSQFFLSDEESLWGTSHPPHCIIVYGDTVIHDDCLECNGFFTVT